MHECTARVALRGDNVKDDTGGHAVFTEHGTSASRMTAAEVLHTISRLPVMSVEANDAVSAYTQFKMSDVPRLLKLPKTECPTGWIGLPRNRRPKHSDHIDAQWSQWNPIQCSSLALSLLRFCPSLVFFVLSIDDFFFLEIVVWRGEAQNRHENHRLRAHF